MTIKELAYSAQQYLQAHTGVSFKRAHIYEMLASSLGYHSYAALAAEAVFTSRRRDSIPASQHNAAIRQRCVELGYLPGAAEVTASLFPVFVDESRIGIVRFVDLVKELRGESSVLNSGPERDDDVQPGDDLDETGRPIGTDPEDEVTSRILLESLEIAAAKGIPLAHYALALLTSAHDEELDSEEGSSYWYSERQQGRVLTGIEKDWAEVYARQLAQSEKYAHHLREAARLGNKQALLDLADRLDDPAFFSNADGAIVENPAKVAEIAERLGLMEHARHWLNIAAEAGDAGAMRRLIEDFDAGDLQRCWMWLYFAKLIGTDLTESNQYAIHDDGSPYDDDVGGTLHVAGNAGVELRPLDSEHDLMAQQAAQELIRQLQHTE
jgi:hypothetical protein